MSNALATPSGGGTDLRRILASQQRRMEALLNGQMPFQQVCALALESINKTPKLAECSPDSIVNAVLQACIGGFRIGGPFPESHLVPYNTKAGWRAQLIVDYRGVISAVTRSGDVTKVEVRSRRESDFFRLVYGTEPRVEHEPELDPEKRGGIVGVYAVFFLADGSTKFDYMTTREVEDVQARSKAKDSGPWQTDWEQMAWKTVIKRGAKTLPISHESRRALSAEDSDPSEVERTEKPADVVRVSDSQASSQPDPEREAVLRELAQLKADHAGAYLAVVEKAPPLEEQDVAGLRVTVQSIQRKAEEMAQNEGSN